MTRPRIRRGLRMFRTNPAELPAGHSPGLVVPRGGSCCANCRHLSLDGRRCHEPNFRAWNGDPVLPHDALSYCSDWWEPRR